MPKPVTFTHTSLLRLTGWQREQIERERKREDKIPSFADMVRALIAEALDSRRVGRETFDGGA